MLKKNLNRILCCLALLVFLQSEAQQINSSYNILWNSPSRNASESMPCGGGDIGMNVWVEQGDLLIYLARSGSFNEDNALMKTGRLRIKLFPNVFSGPIFRQELHLQEGFITVYGENKGVSATVKIWADIFHPVARIEIESNKKSPPNKREEQDRRQRRRQDRR
jgi:hypothetical protein